MPRPLLTNEPWFTNHSWFVNHPWSTNQVWFTDQPWLTGQPWLTDHPWLLNQLWWLILADLTMEWWSWNGLTVESDSPAGLVLVAKWATTSVLTTSATSDAQWPTMNLFPYVVCFQDIWLPNQCWPLIDSTQTVSLDIAPISFPDNSNSAEH